MEDQMGDWTSIKLLYLGHPAPLAWTHMEDWAPVKPGNMHHLTLLASHPGSGARYTCPVDHLFQSDPQPRSCLEYYTGKNNFIICALI